MVRPSGKGSSGKGKGKGNASASKKSRQPAAKQGATGGKRGKSTAAAKTKTRTKKRASDDQIGTQLRAIKGIKTRLKVVVDRFDEAYPDGLDFAPNANDADLA